MNIIIRKIAIVTCSFIIAYNVLMASKFLFIWQTANVININLIEEKQGAYINEALLYSNHRRQDTLTAPKSIIDKSSKLSFLDYKLNQRGKVNVYYYVDICHDYDNYALLWNTLFPRFPNHSRIFKNIADDKMINYGGDSRRFVAFLTPEDGYWYSFQLNCIMGCELIITNSNEFQKDEVFDKFLLRFGIYKKDILNSINNLKKDPKEIVRKESKPVFLQGFQSYLIDVTHVSPHFGMVQVKWRKIGEKHYYEIHQDYLSSLYPDESVDIDLPNIKYMDDNENTVTLKNIPRNSFHKFPTIQSLGTSFLKNCNYVPDYLQGKLDASGWMSYIKTDKLFPSDKFIDHHHDKGTYDLFLPVDKGNKIPMLYIEKVLGRSYTLNRIVHIEENADNTHGKRYFVEVDVIKDGDMTKLYRSSGWIFVNKTSSELCRPMGFEWNEDEKIYLITPVKNQARWIRYLIHSLNELIERTSEKNLHLVMVDFSSTDCKVEDLLKKCNFPFTLLKVQGAFSKVIGLNKAVNSIKEEEALVFVLDLQLQIPDFIFDDIRKHTFKNRTSYVPILCRLFCGEHPQFTNLTAASIWQEIGYGMISIFKSDWLRIGGMDEKQFGIKWGGEDWDFVKRVVQSRIEVIHHRIPGYYHIYHSTIGTWDGTKYH